jgi:hypothetical protein
MNKLTLHLFAVIFAAVLMGCTAQAKELPYCLDPNFQASSDAAWEVYCTGKSCPDYCYNQNLPRRVCASFPTEKQAKDEIRGKKGYVIKKVPLCTWEKKQ